MLLLRRRASRSAFLLAYFMFGPSLRLREATMAAADFWQFIPTPCDAGSPKGKLPDLPGYYALTFTLMPVGYTSRRFRASTGLCENLPAHPTVMPLSAACSSGQRFAFGFLQIPPRDGHPCRSANTSPCRVCRGLAPPSECALPGAQRKRLPKPGSRSDSRPLVYYLLQVAVRSPS